MLYSPIDFVQKNSNSAYLTILLYRLFTLLSTDGDNNNAAVIMEGDAENARHAIAGHENAAPSCRGGKCET